jgi:hypothetical protein
LQTAVSELKDNSPQTKCWARLPWWVPDYKSSNVIIQLLCRRDNFWMWGRFYLVVL